MPLPPTFAIYRTRSVCPCGFPALDDYIPLGQVYVVYPETIRDGGMLCGGCHAHLRLKLIQADQSCGIFLTRGWLPLGVFEMVDDAPQTVQ